MVNSELRVWGRKNSANVQKTLWALEELQLPYSHRLVGGAHGGLADPAFLAMNPNGLVPVLQDGDLTLWESHATVRYLAATYGRDTLWRDDPVERAIVDQWTDWTATTFQPAWLGLFWSFVRTPASQRDPVVIANYHNRTVFALGMLNACLLARPCLAGDSVSYADIVAGVSLHRLFTMDIDLPALPGVEAWYERLGKSKAFQKVVMVSYAELVGRLEF